MFHDGDGSPAASSAVADPTPALATVDPGLATVDPCTANLVDPVARSLAAARPGAALLEQLQRWGHAGDASPDSGVLDDARLDDAALVEAVAACDRLIAHVTAIQVGAMAAFARRRRTEAAAYAALHPVAFARGLASSAAVEELSARRRTSRWAGQRDLDAAELIAARPAVHAALSSGTLDAARATVIATAAAGVAPDHADALVARVLPGAGLVRLEAVRERVRRAAWHLDPASARQAAAAAAAERTVCLIRQVRGADEVGGGGRAVLEVDGPAPEVLTVQAAIEARALALPAASTRAPPPTAAPSGSSR